MLDWTGRELVLKERLTLSDLDNMSLDEVEVHYRFVAAWDEAARNYKPPR